MLKKPDSTNGKQKGFDKSRGLSDIWDRRVLDSGGAGCETRNETRLCLPEARSLTELSPSGAGNLIAQELRMPAPETPDLNLSRLYTETMHRIETLRRRVQQGRDVMAASEFARWLFFSGMVEVFKAHPQDGFNKVDGWLLSSKVEALIELCNERFVSGDKRAQMEKDEVESLCEKVDRMAGYLAKLTVGSNVVILEGRAAPAARPS